MSLFNEVRKRQRAEKEKQVDVFSTRLDVDNIENPTKKMQAEITLIRRLIELKKPKQIHVNKEFYESVKATRKTPVTEVYYKGVLLAV